MMQYPKSSLQGLYIILYIYIYIYYVGLLISHTPNKKKIITADFQHQNR